MLYLQHLHADTACQCVHAIRCPALSDGDLFAGKGYHLHCRLLCSASLQYNVFGQSFKEVLDKEGQDLDWDHNREAFDSAVIYVRKNSVNNFLFAIRALLKDAADKVQPATQQQTQQQQHTQQQQPSRPSESGNSSSRASEGVEDGGGAAVEADADSLLAATDGEEDADMHDVTGVDVVAASDDEGAGEAEDLEDTL